MKKMKKKRRVWKAILLSVLALILIFGSIYFRFGGLGTGASADAEEFAKYAQSIDMIQIPSGTKMIALGEATHGNAEFQQLRLTVFRQAVEQYGVRAFALEGDFGGCEQVNRYIHGENGTAEQAAAAIGFAIYRTQEMADLISYMRTYNESAAPGEDLRFYGFDMQRTSYSADFLMESCNQLGISTVKLEKLFDGSQWNSQYSAVQRKEVLSSIKDQLNQMDSSDASQAIHLVDVLSQNAEVSALADNGEDGNGIRDAYMAENAMWILEQEEARGNDCIFLSGHNSHIVQFGSYDDTYKKMGNLLADQLSDGYYAIGTDFYKTTCNLPKGRDGARTNQVFYSRDPLAKAAKECGFDACWLDFAAIPEESTLKSQVEDYTYMGSIGETYSLAMRLIPMTYRVWQSPDTIYDSMIFVPAITPTVILPAE